MHDGFITYTYSRIDAGSHSVICKHSHNGDKRLERKGLNVNTTYPFRVGEEQRREDYESEEEEVKMITENELKQRLVAKLPSLIEIEQGSTFNAHEGHDTITTFWWKCENKYCENGQVPDESNGQGWIDCECCSRCMEVTEREWNWITSEILQTLEFEAVNTLEKWLDQAYPTVGLPIRYKWQQIADGLAHYKFI